MFKSLWWYVSSAWNWNLIRQLKKYGFQFYYTHDQVHLTKEGIDLSFASSFTELQAKLTISLVFKKTEHSATYIKKKKKSLFYR